MLGKQVLKVLVEQVCEDQVLLQVVEQEHGEQVHNKEVLISRCWCTDKDSVSLAGLSLYLDERRGVQGNTSMRSREFPRAQPEGTPETECWYFPVLPSSRLGTDSVQFSVLQCSEVWCSSTHKQFSAVVVDPNSVIYWGV